MKNLAEIVSAPGRLTLGEVPEGFDAMALADMARQTFADSGVAVIHVARDDARMSALAEAISFFAPDLEIETIPAWDCLPYDRVSPHADVSARRMAALSRLAIRSEGKGGKPLVVIATVNAMLQRVPAREMVKISAWSARVGNRIDLDNLTSYLASNGYNRTGTVREPGEFAVRGGIVDIYPSGFELPVRLDMFGDTLDAIRTFDAATQRTIGQLNGLELVPASEIHLDKETIRRFRAAYVAQLGAVNDGDPLYEAVSEGRKHAGMEHWLPLFHERLETIFDYAPGALITLDAQVEEAREARLELIQDNYEARAEARKTGRDAKLASEAPSYKPLPPDALYLTGEEWKELTSGRALRSFTPFSVPEGAGANLGGRQGRSFAPERAQEGVNIFEALGGHITGLRRSGKRIAIASWSEGSRDRLQHVLGDHGIGNVLIADSWSEVNSVNKNTVSLIVLGIEAGFETDELAVISEQDVLGDRLIRQRRKKRAENFLTEASSLSPGDLVVHVDHGIGRFERLQSIDVMGAPHDCLLLVYHGGDKLYLPVENIELLSRYGADESDAQLDRLGGTGWQARKARLKERIREMAGELIRIAAARELKTAPKIEPQAGSYDEFCARFPFTETDDQLQAIEAVLEDLARGRPMDRLVCGDVGFGKTEVALRTAFVAVMAGYQAAVIVPTTLLARQHFKTFLERFNGLPVKIRQMSRLVSSKEMSETREGLTSGDIDIVIGTHALLGKQVKFRNLGLVIVDEEQHFGVVHKEQLKKFRAEVHVLTLTATPIPRTLQLALSGVRELSIIATPPVDRLAVRTYVSPFDPVVVREALLREHYRGGQSFYVVPRIADLADAEEFLRQYVPEVKFISAHGQMAASEIEDKMTAFYDGKFDVLVSTTIVESGLDIPTANTLVVHRADMFGLAQLYQLRGRVGRSKARAYAYLTVPQHRTLTPGAERRLRVLQSLDSLGAGFSLASHDLDIRGAGNLLGDEQSGHIREVGYELYQEMLEEAVASMRGSGEEENGQWSPQINVGTPVLIPESYVPDLDARMALYRRLSDVETRTEIDGFAAELIDRFGKLPQEVEFLLKIVEIKGLCRTANVEKIEAGPKGVVLTLRENTFPNPGALVELINDERGNAKLRPDHKLVFKRDWETPEERLTGTHRLMSTLAKLADQAKAA
ncbi:transcription-repair coupling factor [Parvibaculum sp.]|uniref:transcription-repair coupling factor n=1 Tax=Parvibaculum sp. TaxID=2024848 RepID=UPI001B1BD716|nr:transcription-repair coupling factor [Parvibaculum sp.]MBO6669301.1 transcription-repair coupling factor [Parvibaculum sp.]MBO6693583.1 transcription-repair coupling factor [Parvibaculum sp.]MBO6712933.1 transcription-repair coupling factor [Parvibaculum sp.]